MDPSGFELDRLTDAVWEMKPCVPAFVWWQKHRVWQRAMQSGLQNYFFLLPSLVSDFLGRT